MIKFQKPLTLKEATDVFSILREECGASESGSYFVTQQILEFQPEYRFGGALGFGGKFRRDRHDGKCWVECYPEDKTPEREQMIENANRRLRELFGPDADEPPTVGMEDVENALRGMVELVDAHGWGEGPALRKARDVLARLR